MESAAFSYQILREPLEMANQSARLVMQNMSHVIKVTSLIGNVIGYSAILLSPSRPPALLLPPVENLFYGTG